MKTINAAVIGWGFMGRVHTLALRGIPLYYPHADLKINLKCICTRRAEVAQQAMEICGFERCTTDYRELLAMNDIDVVSICTPNSLHEEMAIEALRAGKHVCIDKPLADTAESAMRIAAAAQNASTYTHVLYHNRSFPAIRRAKQLIEEGRIGDVIEFSARYLHAGSVDPEKRAGWKMRGEGGAMKDMGSHILDLCTYLIGYPVRGICKTRRLYDQRPTADGATRDLGDDQAIMMLEMPNGALGTLETSKIATGTVDELYLEIRGTRGALRWSLMEPHYLEYYDRTAQNTPIGGLCGWTRIQTVGHFDCPNGDPILVNNAVGFERGHIQSYYDFLQCIAENRPSECDAAAAARLQCLIDRLLDSDRSGTWQSM